jgi:hypothetical protein
VPAIAPDHTLTTMRVLIAGKLARDERRKVSLNEIHV